MLYHDNFLYLQMFTQYPYDNWVLGGASFIVEDFCITSGQDPKQNISKGHLYSCGEDGKINFRIGRKSSSDVLAFFNARMNGGQNTFESMPSHLNFALYGTLLLNLVQDGKGGAFQWHNIMLAQQGETHPPIFWFGGATCAAIGSSKVTTLGYYPQSSIAGYHTTFLKANWNDVLITTLGAPPV